MVQDSVKTPNETQHIPLKSVEVDSSTDILDSKTSTDIEETSSPIQSDIVKAVQTCSNTTDNMKGKKTITKRKRKIKAREEIRRESTDSNVSQSELIKKDDSEISNLSDIYKDTKQKHYLQVQS